MIGQYQSIELLPVQQFSVNDLLRRERHDSRLLLAILIG